MNQTYLHRMGRFPSTSPESLDEALAALAPLIVGVRRQAAPPVFLGAERLHRMHVLVVNRPDRMDRRAAEDDLEQVLPRLTRWPLETQTRPVLGEILRGERGEWYERVGDRIRPMRQLVAGPGGEVLEVPAILAHSRTPPVARQHAVEPEPRASDDPEVSETTSTASTLIPTEPLGKTAPPLFHKLIAEPGAWRVLIFGAFKPILAHQLDRPARLRDSHRLPCHVRVFEAAAVQPIEALAHAILGDQASPVELQPLTPAIVAQLGLAPLLPASANIPPFAKEQGAVRPGQRFFRLTVASDPTANPPPSQATPSAAPSLAVAPPNGAVPTPSAVFPARRTDIPAVLLRPWEFRRTRDEALAMLVRTRSWMAWLIRPLRRLRYHSEFRKWQLLLSGRSADEQLWTIPPPRGWLGDPWLRDWARRTLDLSGYDAPALLSEWEVHWERKASR